MKRVVENSPTNLILTKDGVKLESPALKFKLTNENYEPSKHKPNTYTNAIKVFRDGKEGDLNLIVGSFETMFQKTD